jgi:uncharacterized protein YceK
MKLLQTILVVLASTSVIGCSTIHTVDSHKQVRTIAVDAKQRFLI